jgi:hypothetical protein
VPYFLALKAEALHLANRTSAALGAVTEAEALVETHVAQAKITWNKGKQTHRMRGMVIALPTPDGGWTVVATHYTADYQ